jgi:hypothetical protein
MLMLKYKELYSNNLITVIESNIAPVTNIDIPKKNNRAFLSFFNYIDYNINKCNDRIDYH